MFRIIPTCAIVIVLLESCEKCAEEVNLVAFLVTSFEVNSDRAKTFELLVNNYLSIIIISILYLKIWAHDNFEKIFSSIMYLAIAILSARKLLTSIDA